VLSKIEQDESYAADIYLEVGNIESRDTSFISFFLSSLYCERILITLLFVSILVAPAGTLSQIATASPQNPPVAAAPRRAPTTAKAPARLPEADIVNHVLANV